MDISLNNVTISIADGLTIIELLDGQQIKPVGIAVALNNRIVSRAEWAEMKLQDADKVTVIQATYGG